MPVPLPFRRHRLPTDLGRRLRSARDAKGCTRREIAAAAGIAARTLARIERGQQAPSWHTLRSLCAALEVSDYAIAPAWSTDAMDLPASPESAPGLGLRALRKSRGMTLVQLARLTGTTAGTVSRFERGLAVSRRLAERADEDWEDWYARTVRLAGGDLARAFGFEDVEAFREACIGAWRSTKRGSA